MPHYFFHLHECGEVVVDEEGLGLPNLDAARVTAIRAARDIMCGEVHNGGLCLSCKVAITDEYGAELTVVPFREAITVTGLT